MSFRAYRLKIRIFIVDTLLSRRCILIILLLLLLFFFFFKVSLSRTVVYCYRLLARERESSVADLNTFMLSTKLTAGGIKFNSNPAVCRKRNSPGERDVAPW